MLINMCIVIVVARHCRCDYRQPDVQLEAQKNALVTLKYIATHELTGVLQPIIGDPKRLYVPRRQIQTCIMLLDFRGKICASVGVTSVAYRAHVEATSTMSTMVMPLLILLPIF
jgi:hypothetical protein